MIVKYIWTIYSHETPRDGADKNRTIKKWWILFIVTIFFARICSGRYGRAEEADEYLLATYYYIGLYALSIYVTMLTIKIVRKISLDDIAVTGQTDGSTTANSK
jgi:predicted CDP-diglyceride synthetase/phosphatidate cytidylyltransferase